MGLLAQKASMLLGLAAFSGTPEHAGLEMFSSTRLGKHANGATDQKQ